MKTTKDKLLVILKKHHELSIEEVLEYFTISEPAIRKHLHELERKDIITRCAHKQEIGRPYYTYKLTNKGHELFPNQYKQLPLQLLQDLEELKGRELVDALLRKRMEREEEMLNQTLDGEDFEGKVQKLVELQNESGYMIELEKTEAGDYVLRNYHCPIMNIAKEYRTVCSKEKEMYSHVFEEGKVIPKSYITSGSHVCEWVIESGKKDD